MDYSSHDRSIHISQVNIYIVASGSFSILTFSKNNASSGCIYQYYEKRLWIGNSVRLISCSDKMHQQTRILNSKLILINI